MKKRIKNEIDAFEALIGNDMIIELGKITEIIPGIESFKVGYSIINFYDNNKLKMLLDFIKTNKFDLRLFGTVYTTFKFDEFITALEERIDLDGYL